MATLTPADKRSLGRVENLAREVLRQCSFLRRNVAESESDGERVRWLFIDNDAVRLQKATGQAARRYQRDYDERVGA